MSVWRLHFFKKCNDFVEFCDPPDPPNQVKSTKLPNKFLQPGDFVVTVRGNDIRGLKSVDIWKEINKVQVEKPLYFLVLKAQSNQLYLQKHLKVSMHSTSISMAWRAKIRLLLLYQSRHRGTCC